LQKAEKDCGAKVNLARRMELLTCNASRNISQARRTEILAELLAWLESDFCSVKGEEEKFWMCVAAAGMHMEAYCEEVQAQIGGKILDREMSEK
jgi:hypothetical protein